MTSLSQQIENLFVNQLHDWPLAKSNYESLQNVRNKDFCFDGFNVCIQFNPARVHSSAAKVDSKSIQERKCFLCPQNLPVEQKGITFGNDYQVLVNPFPIFPRHFTIPSYSHTDQLILGRYGDMLDLAKTLEEYVIFYNGPKSGASAPDHAHFQAGLKGVLPIERNILDIDNLIYKTDNLIVYTSGENFHNFFLLESDDKKSLADFFNQLYSFLEIKDKEKEPMMNVITWFDDDRWYSCVFPREKHRPDCFYTEGDENILVSPGSVDMGGILILPMEKDFNKITDSDIKEIYKEVCINDEKMTAIVDKIKSI